MSNDPSAKDKAHTVVAQFAERVLVGTIEAIARAGAKALESLANDGRKALEAQAEKVEALEKGVAGWRADKLGDDDGDDLPGSLRSNGRNGSTTRQEHRS